MLTSRDSSRDIRRLLERASPPPSSVTRWKVASEWSTSTLRLQLTAPSSPRARFYLEQLACSRERLTTIELTQPPRAVLGENPGDLHRARDALRSLPRSH